MRTLPSLIVCTALAAGIVMFACVPLAGPAHAGVPQGSLLPQPSPSSGLLNSGLLDFSRFDINHSLSYGVSSGTGGSQSGGLWLTEIGYRLSDPLRISVDVGASLDTDGGPVFSENSFYLHSLNLDYRPSKNFLVNISYVNLPDNTSLFSRQGMLGRRAGLWDSPLGYHR